MTFPRVTRWLAALLVAVWMGWWLIGPWPVPHPPVAAIPTSPATLVGAASGERAFLNATSCAAARCHGGVHAPDRPAWNSAYTVWRVDDPHARALTDLLAPRGQEMARRYFADEGKTRPEQDQRCLACHVTPDTPVTLAAEEGVGCESCHGPSQQWRDQHYLPGWESTRAADGFHDLRQPAVRARVCVPCHVGAPDREVNHDLIAAGHPPLKFEMGAFHEQLPKHWDFSKECKQDPHLEARLWLAGQVESARAALALLAHRAARTDGVWPELAEYDCESCHHPLATPSWRQALPATDHEPAKGSPLWGTWYFSPRIVAAGHALLATDNPDQRPELETLRRKMGTLAAPRQEVQSLARSMQSRWPEFTAASSALSIEAQQAAWELLAAPPTTSADATWSGAAQRWLALAALATTAESDASRMALLRRWREHLASPATFEPSTQSDHSP